MLLAGLFWLTALLDSSSAHGDRLDRDPDRAAAAAGMGISPRPVLDEHGYVAAAVAFSTPIAAPQRAVMGPAGTLSVITGNWACRPCLVLRRCCLHRPAHLAVLGIEHVMPSCCRCPAAHRNHVAAGQRRPNEMKSGRITHAADRREVSPPYSRRGCGCSHPDLQRASRRMDASRDVTYYRGWRRPPLLARRPRRVSHRRLSKPTDPVEQRPAFRQQGRRGDR